MQPAALLQRIICRWEGMTLSVRDIESVYTDNSSMVYWTAYGILKSDSDASDVMQSVFLKAMKHFSKLEGMNDAQMKGWLYRVAVNLCYDIKRKLKKEAPAEELPEVESGREYELPEISAISKDQRERVRAAIDQLPEIYREAVLLHYFSGMGYKDIAALFDTTEGTIKSRISRAKDRLYALLKEGEKND